MNCKIVESNLMEQLLNQLSAQFDVCILKRRKITLMKLNVSLRSNKHSNTNVVCFALQNMFHEVAVKFQSQKNLFLT